MSLEHFFLGMMSVMFGCLMVGLGVMMFASVFLFSLRFRWIVASFALTVAGFGLMIGSLFIR